jgi:hypothetical protein
MLTRRLVPRSLPRPSPSPLIPSTTSLQSRSYAAKKAPALGDIQPDAAEGFNAAQKQFRDRLKADASERKRREQEESMSRASRSSATKSFAANSDRGSDSILGSTLSSLSSSFAEDARAREESSAGKKAGPLTSLIYGTQEGRELDRDLERSFSQVLARGKYVHSIVFHQVKPDKVDEYVELVGGWYPKVADMPEMKVHLVGSWRTEVGDCDTFGM